MIYQPSDVLQRLDQPVGHESAVWIRILSMLIHTAALWDYPLLHTAVCANSHFRLTYSHSSSACTQLAVWIRSSVLLICTAALWIRTFSQLICTDGCVNKEPSPAAVRIASSFKEIHRSQAVPLTNDQQWKALIFLCSRPVQTVVQKTNLMWFEQSWRPYDATDITNLKCAWVTALGPLRTMIGGWKSIPLCFPK